MDADVISIFLKTYHLYFEKPYYVKDKNKVVGYVVKTFRKTFHVAFVHLLDSALVTCWLLFSAIVAMKMSLR